MDHMRNIGSVSLLVRLIASSSEADSAVYSQGRRLIRLQKEFVLVCT